MGRWLSSQAEHKRVTALLSPYLDGRASEAERALVERHLQSCADCTRNLATLRVTVAAVREMPRVRAPHSFALSLSVAKRPQTAPQLFPVLRAATAVATLLLVITVAGDLYLRGTSAPVAAPAPLAQAPVAQELGVRAVPSASTIAPLGTPQAAVADKGIPATPIEPPVEDLLSGGGMGGDAGPGVGAAALPAPVPPSASPAPTVARTLAGAPVTPETEAARPADAASSPTARPHPTQALAATPAVAASAQPTVPARAVLGPTPTAEPQRAPATSAAAIAPTQVARAPAPQPSAAERQETASQVAPQSLASAINPLRILEGVLAVLAIGLGVTAWVVYRRSR